MTEFQNLFKQNEFIHSKGISFIIRRDEFFIIFLIFIVYVQPFNVNFMLFTVDLESPEHSQNKVKLKVSFVCFIFPFSPPLF